MLIVWKPVERSGSSHLAVADKKLGQWIPGIGCVARELNEGSELGHAERARTRTDSRSKAAPTSPRSRAEDSIRKVGNAAMLSQPAQLRPRSHLPHRPPAAHACELLILSPSLS